MDFSSPNEDSVLVDFDGGNEHFERKVRKDDRVDTFKVDEKVSTEVLLVSNEGRVTARNTLYDALDRERQERQYRVHRSNASVASHLLLFRRRSALGTLENDDLAVGRHIHLEALLSDRDETRAAGRVRAPCGRP